MLAAYGAEPTCRFGTALIKHPESCHTHVSPGTPAPGKRCYTVTYLIVMSSEQPMIHNGRDDGSGDGAHPEDPVVAPCMRCCRRTKRARRVDTAGAGHDQQFRQSTGDSRRDIQATISCLPAPVNRDCHQVNDEQGYTDCKGCKHLAASKSQSDIPPDSTAFQASINHARVSSTFTGM